MARSGRCNAVVLACYCPEPSLTDLAVVARLKTEHLVARTCFSVLSVSRTVEHFDLSHAHACGSRHDWDVLHTCALQKSSTLTA